MLNIMQYTGRSTRVRLHRTSNPRLREAALTVAYLRVFKLFVRESLGFATTYTGLGFRPEGGGCIVAAQLDLVGAVGVFDY